MSKNDKPEPKPARKLSHQEEDEARDIAGIRNYEVVFSMKFKANNYADAVNKADLYFGICQRLCGDVVQHGPMVPTRD